MRVQPTRKPPACCGLTQTEAVEDALKAIFVVAGHGEPVTTSALAQHLRVTPPTVSVMLKRLAAHGLARRGADHTVGLTEHGADHARAVVRRHRLVETFLARALDVPWDEVHAEAEALEHAVSDRLLARIDDHLNHPTADPHGDPIPPPSGGHVERWGLRLDNARPGVFRIERVDDRDSAALRYLADIGVRPGVSLEVGERAPFGGPLWLRVGGREQALGDVLTALVCGTLVCGTLRHPRLRHPRLRRAPERPVTSRRGFLAGAAGAAIAAVPLSGAAGGPPSPGAVPPGGGSGHGGSGHGGGINGPTFGGAGGVDHTANGFNPTDVLRSFDPGQVTTLPDGRTLREWSISANDKDVEVAPGVTFPAWTFNGRIPGPTLRATEGDRLRVRFTNDSAHPHTMHFHGIHPAEMDGVPMVGRGVISPGEEFVYEFDAEPFGLHLYHCHVGPLAEHIARGMYGTFIVDPVAARPPADELVMVMMGYNTTFDAEGNQLYAVNGIPFHYNHEPVQVRRGELVRIYLVNILEYDPVNSFHLHANFFDYYPTGTRLAPTDFTDTVVLGQGQRGICELRFPHEGRFMFHAHKTEFADLGWMGFFEVTP